MHFFNEAMATEYKEPKTRFELYMGRAKLNLLIAQFGKCKEDALEALKFKDTDEQMWLILSRSRYFVEKWQEGMKYTEQGLAKCPGSPKLLHMKGLYVEALAYEKQCIQDVATLQAQKEDGKMKIYRNLRSKKVKLGKKVHHLPESVEL
mmetsp:Transcript_32917/g.50329  ORF Transcript_32917/g.50329 Transcript_32917/m.50329 type:complete len:149 (+) Transcript_32917:345-791(+)